MHAPPSRSRQTTEQQRKPVFATPEIDDTDIKLVRKLGTGCFGTVWKGTCLHKDVAIKIPIIQNLNRQQLAAFRREVEIMSSNHHPNICLFMGACTVPGKFKIVTELMDTDLETLLQQSNVKLSLYERMKMAKDAALGMNWLHGSTPAIIHRDLKTANLLIEKTANLYRVKLCDFGLSEIKPKEKLFLQDPANGAKGTPLFMPPEVMRGQPFDEKSDVYSFGIVLWEILTRKEPFAEYEDYDEFTEAICDRHVRPAIPDYCPPVLRALMEQCWHPDPKARPDFEEINNQLDIILVHAAISDEQGRRFWEENFIRQEEVEWDDFARAFYAFLKLDLPEDEAGDSMVSPYLLVGSISEVNSQSTSTGGGSVEQSGSTSSGGGGFSSPFSTASVGDAAETDDDDLPGDDVLSLRCLKALLMETDKSKRKWVNVERFGQVLNWFGPLVRPKDSPQFIDVIRETLAQLWFHGNIETGEAQRRLNGQGPGCFLIRFSTNPTYPTCYTISKVSKDGKTAHIRISHAPGEGFSVNDEHTYASLEELVTKLGKALDLRTPCPGSQYASLFSGDGGLLGGYIKYTGA
jgi:serine/threonine protein kinase